MKSFRREAIPFVHVEYHLTYKYIERSLALNHDEELEIIVSILGAIDFGEYALVHPDVIKNMSSLGLGFGLEYSNLNMYQIYIYNFFGKKNLLYYILIFQYKMIQVYHYFLGTINFNIITSMVKQVLCHLISIYFHVFGPKVRCMCPTSHSTYKSCIFSYAQMDV